MRYKVVNAEWFKRTLYILTKLSVIAKNTVYLFNNSIIIII